MKRCARDINRTTLSKSAGKKKKSDELSMRENYFYVRHSLYRSSISLSVYTSYEKCIHMHTQGVCTAAPMSTLCGVISSVSRALHTVITILAMAPNTASL